MNERDMFEELLNKIIEMQKNYDRVWNQYSEKYNECERLSNELKELKKQKENK
jgi:hypothetical protein